MHRWEIGKVRVSQVVEIGPVHFDTDGEMARATRRSFLACCAGDGSLVLGTHFAHPTAGRVVTAGGAWRFEVL